MPTKMTSAEIIETAIIWAEESMEQMLFGLSDDDAHRVVVKDQLKQLRAYRKRRFGKRIDPFEGAKLLGLDELRKLPPASL